MTNIQNVSSPIEPGDHHNTSNANAEPVSKPVSNSDLTNSESKVSESKNTLNEKDMVYVMDMNGTLRREVKVDERIPLYVLGLFPMEGQWSGGWSLLTATQIGLEYVNAREDLLPGYTLNLIWNNTKVLSYQCIIFLL